MNNAKETHRTGRPHAEEGPETESRTVESGPAGAAALRPSAGRPPRPLPPDHSQAILEATKHVAAIIKTSGYPFALAGSVAAHAHGVPVVLQHDTDFCIRREDVEGVVAALREGDVEFVPAAEDWLVKARASGEGVDLIYELARRPVTAEMLARAPMLPVESVRMPMLAPYDLLSSQLAALSEQHCDFGPLLHIGRTLRERIDWDKLRDEYQQEPLPDAFFYLLERLGVIDPGPREAVS
ncbi:hypothetical protein OG905_02985 [Streptomyces sp. NBC_00322]|uniref:hypothetical protein n=1 Tax=Streptomyces sp. NBC_00322 TaxID=2975712 RepID=UPI002E29DED1|nr:hypothetical protein [Streptomyces sp. NBC_00322]